MTWLPFIIDRIGRSPIRYDPWPHIYVPEIFPHSLYSELLAYRRREELTVLNPKLPQRSLMWLKSDGPDMFWTTFAFQLLHEEFRKFLSNHFGVMWGTKAEAQLICDQPGYQLGPHTDIPNKILTGLFYLPDWGQLANDMEENGTGIYISRSGVECGGMKEHAFSDDFERKVLIPYRPNSAVFFPRTNWSFHGVTKTTVERWLISYDILH